MTVKRTRIDNRIIEIRSLGYNIYYVDLREDAGNWSYDWEVRKKDNTRPVRGQVARSLEDAEKIYQSFIKGEMPTDG